MNIGWYLESATWDHPMKVAAINGHTDEKITYLELNTLANKIGNVLKEKWQIKEDDVVTTLMTEDWFHQAIMYGILKIGGVFCGLNRTHLIDKLVYDLKTTKARLLIISSDFLELGQKLAKQVDGLNIMVREKVESKYPSLSNLLENASGDLRMVPRAYHDLAAINFTAGTSGPSKGVMFCHGILATSVQGSIFWGGISAKDVVVAPIGLFHSGGISDSVRSVMAKATVIWMAGWTSDKAAKIILRYKPTWFHFIVPTMIRDLQNHPKFDELDLNGMKANVAGAPVPADMQEMLNKRGMRTVNFYGMTETMPCIVTLTSMYYGDWKNPVLGSSGKDFREFGIAKIVDPMGKEITKPGERGEIWFKGDVLTPGYFGDPEKTKEAIDAEGWFHTRDIAYKNEDGYYFVGGRVDDMILCGGEKLSLVEIDQVLLKCPLLKDAASIGVPHDRFGEVPAAFVVSHNKDMSEEELKNELDKYCMDKLERWKRPRLYVKAEKIPRTLAKGTKSIQEMKKAVEGIQLSDEDGSVTTSTKIKDRIKK